MVVGDLLCKGRSSEFVRAELDPDCVRLGPIAANHMSDTDNEMTRDSGKDISASVLRKHSKYTTYNLFKDHLALRDHRETS